MTVAARFSFLATLALALALPGCGSSRATFSSDEDAFPAPAGSANQKPTRPVIFTVAPPSSNFTDNHVVYGSDFSSEPTNDSPDDISDFDNLELNAALKNKLAVLRVGSGLTESHLLSVFAGVKNKSTRPLTIEVQTIYRDKDGHQLTDGRSSWIPITLRPHQETQYRSMAISEQASDFLVRIRNAAPTPAPESPATDAQATLP